MDDGWIRLDGCLGGWEIIGSVVCLDVWVGVPATFCEIFVKSVTWESHSQLTVPSFRSVATAGTSPLF